MSGAARVLVCRTCPRYEPKPPAGAATRGTALGQAVRAGFHDTGIDVRVVNCLAGCKNPCNVALDGGGRHRLRFSRIEARDIEALRRAADHYSASIDGRLGADELGEGLANRLSAVSPPRIGD